MTPPCNPCMDARGAIGLSSASINERGQGGHGALRRFSARDLFRRAQRRAAQISCRFRGARGARAGGDGAVAAQICPGRLRRRVHAGQQCLGLSALGHRAADDGRLLGARPVDRSVRHDAADAAVHGAHRGHRPLHAGRAWRHRRRARRGADRGAADRLDAVERSDGGRRRGDGRHAGLFPALYAEGQGPGREPRPPCRSGGIQGDHRHARHLGNGLATARPQRFEFPAAARARPVQLLVRPPASARWSAARPKRMCAPA